VKEASSVLCFREISRTIPQSCGLHQVLKQSHYNAEALCLKALPTWTITLVPEDRREGEKSWNPSRIQRPWQQEDSVCDDEVVNNHLSGKDQRPRSAELLMMWAAEDGH